jgi:hypothetical protein
LTSAALMPAVGVEGTHSVAQHDSRRGMDQHTQGRQPDCGCFVLLCVRQHELIRACQDSDVPAMQDGRQAHHNTNKNPEAQHAPNTQFPPKRPTATAQSARPCYTGQNCTTGPLPTGQLLLGSVSCCICSTAAHLLRT